MSATIEEHIDRLILDGTKIGWHLDRVQAWMDGKRIAPITIDMALTRTCNYGCHYCYAMLQENERSVINKEVITNFLDDCAEIGVKGISLVSDGESTISPVFVHACEHGKKKGIAMACGTNGFVLTRSKSEQVLPHLTYLRINISAGERKRYAEIMGVKEEWFDRVVQNIKDMVEIKRRDGLTCTLGLQMVLMPEYADQILPLAELGRELGVDYLVIKHCSDNEDGDLGVNYKGYTKIYDLLRAAEALSTNTYQCTVKWSKIQAEGTRSYQRCYGAPFLLQVSGSGLIAPCGMLFNEKYKKFHIGNICEERFKDIWSGERYWEVMNYLASPEFNAQKMCGSLCLQHKVNETLDGLVKGTLSMNKKLQAPAHMEFI
jgi:MoaA/NifB/PqqE/SkfB family radical SAM enzyme